MIPKIHRGLRPLAVVVVATLAISAHAQTTTITGTDGGNDSWNIESNWDDGVPSGEVDVIVSEGVLAQVNNPATPSYSGSLLLGAGSTLKVSGPRGTGNAIMGATSITMDPGSTLQINVHVDLTLAPIELEGDASIQTLFGASDWQTTRFGSIDGDFTLTLSGFNGHNFNFTAANTCTELICNAIDRHNVHAMAADCLGVGDVSIYGRADGRSAQLYLDVAATIADTATLTLNGRGFDNGNDDRITIAAGVDEVVAALIVDDAEMAPGTYDSTEAWLSGDGTLTVAPVGGRPFFVRGDADANGEIAVTDGIYILNFLFTGGPPPSCANAADADGRDDISLSDGVYVLNFLFLGGTPPLAPWPECGANPDVDASLICETSHPGCG